MKIVIPFINEMWNHMTENFDNYVQYDVVKTDILLAYAAAQNIEQVEKMISQIMYGEVIAYAFDNYNIIKGKAVPDVVFVLKLKKAAEFDKNVFSINQDVKINKVGRWVTIEKDWTEDAKAYEERLSSQKKLKNLTKDISLSEEAFEKEFDM